MAAVAALEGDPSHVMDMVDMYRHRRDIAVAELVNHGLHTYTPEGAFYILVDTLGGRDVRIMTENLVP